MKSSEVIKRLEREGWVRVAWKGSHVQFKQAGRGRVTVPHPRKDIPIGTLRSIFLQAGWPWPPSRSH